MAQLDLVKVHAFLSETENLVVSVRQRHRHMQVGTPSFSVDVAMSHFAATKLGLYPSYGGCVRERGS